MTPMEQLVDARKQEVIKLPGARRPGTTRRRRLPHWMSLAGCLPWDFRRSCLLIRNAGRASKHAEHEWCSHPGGKRKRARPLWTKVCAVAVDEMRACLFRHLLKEHDELESQLQAGSKTICRPSHEGSCTRALSGDSGRIGDAQAKKILEKQCVPIK